MAIYTIKSQASGFCLNVNGNTQVSPHRNVNVYRSMGSDDQNWVIGSFSGNQLIKSNISASYALNAYRVGSPWNCDIYPWSGNLNDAEVCFESVSSNVYRIRLAHHAGYYLTAQGAASGSNVVWAAQNGSSIYQKWRVERVPSSGGGVTNTTLKNYPFLSQYSFTASVGYEPTFADSACMATCYLTIANYFGKNTTMQNLINVGDVDGYSGEVLRFTLIGVDNSYIYSTAVPSSVIKSEIAANRPVILRLSPNNNLKDTHFVVVHGYMGEGTSANQILVMDPARRVENGQIFHGTLADAVKYQHRLGRVLTGYRKVYRK